ncbi:hypothetical protein JCM11641_001111 [Rhodosporidiobolus odoratus]
MGIDPSFFTMGAKTWRDPVTHAKFVEEEKAKREEAKKKKEAAAHEKKVERATDKLARQKLRSSGRILGSEDEQNNYLAKLKADVARLEAKATGNTPEQLIAAHDQERATNEAGEREKATEKEIQMTAMEMLKAQEKELQEKKKKQDTALAELAEKRRRELLEYKHTLGLSASREPPHRPVRLPNRPLSLYDDPEYWKLPAQDQQILEVMSPDGRAKYGFGPYEEDETEYDPALQERFGALDIGSGKVYALGAGTAGQSMQDKMKRFVCTEHPDVPGIFRRFEPLTLSLPLDILSPEHYDTAEDRQTCELILQEQSQHLQNKLIQMAIQHGANGMVEYSIQGPFPIEDEVATAEGIVSELVAQGIPVRLDPASAHHPKPAAGKGVRFANALYPSKKSAQSGWGGGLSALFGHGNNGGAGWEDPLAFDGGLGGGKKDHGGWGGAEGVGNGAWGGGASNPWQANAMGKNAGGWGEQLPHVAGGSGWGGGSLGCNGGWGEGGGGGGWNAAHAGGGWGERSHHTGAGWGAGGGLGGWGVPDLGWGGGGGKGAVWGGAGGGQGWGGGKKGAAMGTQPDAPAGVKDLPFGAQMYVTKMREQQEREMREAAAAAASGMDPMPPAAVAAPTAAPKPVGEDPALFGNSFSRSSYAFTPTPSAIAASAPMASTPMQATAQPNLGAYASAGPSQLGALHPNPAAMRSPNGLQDRLMAQISGTGGSQQPTVDSDHGGGMGGAGRWGEAPLSQSVPAVMPATGIAAAGWGQTETVALPQAEAQNVKPAAQNGWRGAMPW